MISFRQIAISTDDALKATRQASAKAYNTKGADLVGSVGFYIKSVLGFLGLLAFLIVIYAAYLWMTAAGNDDQVGKAKKYLRNSVIGLIIIGAAFSITSFLVTSIAQPPCEDCTAATAGSGWDSFTNWWSNTASTLQTDAGNIFNPTPPAPPGQ